MIHSMAGGRLGSVLYNDFAKVKILEGENEGNLYWFLTDIPLLNVGDNVVVPLGIANKQTKAEVVRIDKNVSSQCSPVPVKKCKYIIRKTPTI